MNRITTIALLSLLASGCASTSEMRSIKNDTVALKAQMSMLQQKTADAADVDSLLTYTAALEHMLKDQMNFLWSLKADINARISGLDDRLQTLDAKISQSGRQFSTLSRQVEGVKARLAAPDTTGGQFVDPVVLYNTAMEDMQRGNYELAISEFMQYLQQFPDTQLADNAQYWIGECYYAQKQYERALAEFELVLKNYPEDDKVSAALLKIGFTYLAQNDAAKARSYIQRVIQEFPNSEEAKLARIRLETLPGK